MQNNVRQRGFIHASLLYEWAACWVVFSSRSSEIIISPFTEHRPAIRVGVRDSLMRLIPGPSPSPMMTTFCLMRPSSRRNRNTISFSCSSLCVNDATPMLKRGCFNLLHGLKQQTMTYCIRSRQSHPWPASSILRSYSAEARCRSLHDSKYGHVFPSMHKGISL